MTFKTLKFAALVGGVSCAFGAVAGAAADFGVLDSNHNGTIEQIEASDHQQLEANWKALDGNGDNVIDAAEFARFEATEADPSGDADAGADVKAEGEADVD